MTPRSQSLIHHEGPAALDGDDAINLRQILNTLWRRKIVVMGTTLVATSVALLVVMRLTPLYVAEAEVVVEPPQTNILDIKSVAPGLSTDWQTNETQAAILASRVLAEKVVDRFDLIHDPAFNPDLRPKREGLLERFDPWSLVPESWRTALRDFRRGTGTDNAGPDIPLTREEAEAELREFVVDDYLSRLSVQPNERSRVIAVSFMAEEPVLAARLANAAAEAYIDDQIRAKTEKTKAAYTWLQDRAVELKGRVEASARAVEKHRRKTGLLNVEGSSLLAQQLAELNSSLIAARAQRAEAEAREHQITKLLDSPGGVDSAAAVLDSPLIQRLREQEAQVVRKIAEMKTQYRDGHPKMILAKSELQDLVAKIEKEVRKIALNLGNELEIARVRERNLNTEVANLTSQLESQAGAEITLKALETDLEANQKLYDTILARLKETAVQDDSLVQPDARVISYATVPGAPTFPRKKMIIGIAFVGSTLLGVLIVILLEQLDSGFRGREQLESVTGFAVIGMTPRLRGRRLGKVAPYDDVIERPYTALAEAIRMLRTSLMLSNVDRSPRTILVTSSLPAEGKTTTALALARTAARHGQKAIIIDADLRNPTLHAAFDVTNDLGLIDYLSRDAALNDMIQIDFKSGLHYVLTGHTAPHPTDLLGSDKMRGLLYALRDIYDLVIIDTPPVLAMSDTLVLLRCVDKTLFLVRWEKTRRETALAGLRQVIDAGADLAGLVLTQVDLKRQAQYQYGDTLGYGYYGYGRDGAKRAAE